MSWIYDVNLDIGIVILILGVIAWAIGAVVYGLGTVITETIKDTARKAKEAYRQPVETVEPDVWEFEEWETILREVNR